MTTSIHTLGPRALEIDITGKLDKEDYRRFVPEAENRIHQHGGVDLLIRASDFKGWTPSALWQDLKFDAKHYGDVDRLAIVGEDESQEWVATVSKPFTGATIEYFPSDRLEDARRWVQGGDPKTTM